MEKYGKLGLYGLIAVCFLTLLSGISHASVAGTSHDLSYSSPAGFTFDTDEVCVFCHTPHGASGVARNNTFYRTGQSGYINTTAGTGDPILLWNRPLSNAATQEGYQTYSSSTMNADTTQVRIYSLMCLSCHDGVSAMNVLFTNPAPGHMTDVNPADGLPDMLGSYDQIGDFFPNNFGPGPNIGNRLSPTHGWYGTSAGPADLRNDHPISIDYEATHPDVVSGGLNDPSGIDTSLKLFPRPGSGAPTSIECSTCHNPHDAGSAVLGTEPFLVMSIDGSQLCLECHNK